MNSNNKKALIITSKYDEHADYIINKINHFGMSEHVIRLNTEDFRTNITYVFNGKEFVIEIKDSSKCFCSSDIGTVWYRRPIQEKLDSVDIGVGEFISSQVNHFLLGLYYCLDDNVLWINDMKANLFARNKLYQLQIANRVGLNVPDVLVSNNEKYIDSFIDNNEIVCNKSLSVPRYNYNGKEYPFMTRLVSEDDIHRNIDSIKMCPTFFEQYIEKRYDIRVVVMGDEIYSFAIYSQENDLSKVDVRGLSPLKLKHEIIELPDDIKKKISSFVKEQNLFFSSIDLVYSSDNKYYFIENNCNGQWLWLENVTGINMSDHFINVLLK